MSTTTAGDDEAKSSQISSISLPAPLRVLPNPTTGSANPAASLSSLWAYLKPALDHLVRSPIDDPSKPPAIEFDYHMGAHTTIYNYITSSLPSSSEDDNNSSGLYMRLDGFFAQASQELLLGAPYEGSTLILYIVTCFSRYAMGAHAVNRLLNYVNRHLVKRAVDDGKGWLRLEDVLESAVLQSIFTDNTSRERKKQPHYDNLREKREMELKKWGYVDGGSAALMAEAEARAEAGSDADRIVPVSSLAFRRFRINFFEPLLAVPRKKSKGKESQGEKAGPKGRLARATKVLLESAEVAEEDRKRLADELANALKTVGVRSDHPLRKKLDKFVADL
jgi:hypothetical protein